MDIASVVVGGALVAFGVMIGHSAAMTTLKRIMESDEGE